MFAIVGVAGNVGYSTSRALRKAGVPVRAILCDAERAARLAQIGCQVAIQDAEALAKAIGNADAVQLTQSSYRPATIADEGSHRRSAPIAENEAPRHLDLL